MGLSKDCKEFLELLNSRGVDYVIVGAHSLALHGRPRYTGDLDILVRPSPENARLVIDTLNEFGFTKSGFKEADFLKPDQLIQLGRAPTRIDLLTSISGVSSDEAFASKVWAELDGIPVSVLGKDALIRNKRAVGRPQVWSISICWKTSSGTFVPDAISPPRTFDRTNVASSVAVLPQAPALPRVSLASQPALLFLV